MHSHRNTHMHSHRKERKKKKKQNSINSWGVEGNRRKKTKKEGCNSFFSFRCKGGRFLSTLDCLSVSRSLACSQQLGQNWVGGGGRRKAGEGKKVEIFSPACLLPFFFAPLLIPTFPSSSPFLLSLPCFPSYPIAYLRVHSRAVSSYLALSVL